MAALESQLCHQLRSGKSVSALCKKCAVAISDDETDFSSKIKVAWARPRIINEIRKVRKAYTK